MPDNAFSAGAASMLNRVSVGLDELPIMIERAANSTVNGLEKYSHEGEYSTWQ